MCEVFRGKGGGGCPQSSRRLRFNSAVESSVAISPKALKSLVLIISTVINLSLFLSVLVSWISWSYICSFWNKTFPLHLLFCVCLQNQQTTSENTTLKGFHIIKDTSLLTSSTQHLPPPPCCSLIVKIITPNFTLNGFSADCCLISFTFHLCRTEETISHSADLNPAHWGCNPRR